VSDDSHSKEGADPGKGAKARSGRVHSIAVDKLIVHKYSGSVALLQKADKIAREILAEEIREGEYFRVLRPGRYSVHLPKLIPEAGQLRISIILDRIFRAIRDFNPTAIQIRIQDESALEPPPLKLGTLDADLAPARASSPRQIKQEKDEDVEMRKLASQAMSMMASKAISSEELIASDVGRLLQAELDIKRVPVWNIKSELISAYECVAVRRGTAALKDEAALHLGLDAAAEVRAIIDILVYKIIGAILTQNLEKQRKTLLLCPVHASTLEHTRYASAYLGSGAGIPAAAQKFLVFLVTGIKTPISRLRLRDLTGYLRSRCRGLVADMPFDVQDVSLFKEFGFHGVRMSASAGGLPEERLFKAVNEFAEMCKNAKLESFVGDLTTKSAAIGALASGCTYLSGAVIAKRSRRSGTVEAFDLDSLFMTRG
jgi:hypothetical protein